MPLSPVDLYYRNIHAGPPQPSHKPVIGITANYGDGACSLARGYYESVLRAGALPVLLPPTDDAAVMTAMLEHVDGLLLSGGGDINPLLLNEEPIPELHSITPERDMFELMLTRLAADRQMPMLGICRGMQVIAAALGGSLWQDISKHVAEPIKHSQQMDRAYASHTVRLEESSRVRAIFNNVEEIAVNSFHHQAVADGGPMLRITARATDGVAEAIESTSTSNILAVQWHPECFILRGDEVMMPLFRWLCGEAELFARARSFHQRHITLDSHCDTPMFFDNDIHFEQRDERILVDLHKMTEGRLDATIMAAYIPQGELTDAGRAAAKALADRRIDGIMALTGHQGIEIARTPAELPAIKARGNKAIMIGIENGYAIGRDLSLLNHFANRGIVYMTLCHNGNNDICGSARPRDGEREMGLTSFGHEVVTRMNELGILVDMSHASVQSFYDAMDASRTPIVCSHSSARALCDHPRNLTDQQLHDLARKGGVAQATLYDGFLRKGGGADINDFIAHVDHMIHVAGIEHVGIGTDFDGDGGVPGLASAAELINFTREALRRHYSEDDLQLIWGGNFMRVMTMAQES